ncbi:hypothetical protein A4R26_32825 [Niastella populi]|uniref:Uncharacterized protein n=2 Tax=Niastella populi TaxID=550983 RepID=A0A1V9GB82_9BACT|nr:hypothetical protein A4R26_32825 [Niastella populi]
MERITQMKMTGMESVTDKKAIKRYIDDPYFVKKREIGAAFLKKVGLPESFKKPQTSPLA